MKKCVISVLNSDGNGGVGEDSNEKRHLKGQRPISQKTRIHLIIPIVSIMRLALSCCVLQLFSVYKLSPKIEVKFPGGRDHKALFTCLLIEPHRALGTAGTQSILVNGPKRRDKTKKENIHLN